jgi:phage/plasmid-associated DNA primase
MDPELRDILRLVAKDTCEDTYTHATLYGPKSRWSIPHHNRTTFWSSYCDLVDKKLKGSENCNPEPLANLCLAEQPHEVMPLIADFMFRFHADDDDKWEPYDEDFLEYLCHIYQNVLIDMFQVDVETQLQLITTVLESTSPWFEEDNENNHRYMMLEVRLQFPYARISLDLQNQVIRPRVLQLLRINNVMSKMSRQPIGDWEQILVPTVTTEPIVLFGSSSVPGRPKLEISHIWPYITQENVDGISRPDEITLQDVFIPDNHGHFNQNPNEKTIFEQKDDIQHWLPLFLSVEYWPPVLRPKENIEVKNKYAETSTHQAQNRSLLGNKFRNPIEEDDMEFAETLISMLKRDRFLKESFWLDIGKALYSAGDGSENGLLAWIRHTERALLGVPVPDFIKTIDNVQDTCSNLYHTFADSDISIKTLGFYARLDSPEAYANWHKEWCMPSMEDALTGCHTDVTIALYRVYWLDFIYCPIGAGKWFQFRHNRWYEINQGIALRKCISSDFMKRFEAARVVLSRQIHSNTDETYKNNAELTMKKITSLIGKLKNVTFKSSIITEAREQFNHNKFLSLLDSNADLLGTTNGVIEVLGPWAVYRISKPEDYVSMSTNIPFQENYNWDNPLVRECMKWFSQVFCTPQLLHHFLKFAASCLKGRNSDKIFPIWTGEGDNSKSMIAKLFETTFNCYCIKFPISLITEKGGNSSGPTPQLARAKSTRIAFLDEPESDVQLTSATIKRYTGGDSFFARMLQDNGGDIQSTFKMILLCNKVPIIPNADKAIKNRTRLFPFLATYCDDAPDDNDEQMKQRRFKKNPQFERRIPILAPAFLWILTQYFPHYASEGLQDPDIVKETTENYWKENDVYSQFTADMIQEVFTLSGDRDPSARLTLTEIYNEYKVWYRQNFPSTKIPERQVVKSELTSKWGKMVGNSWYGIRLLEQESFDQTAMLSGRSQHPTEKKADTAAHKDTTAKDTTTKDTTTKDTATKDTANTTDNSKDTIDDSKDITTNCKQLPDRIGSKLSTASIKEDYDIDAALKQKLLDYSSKQSSPVSTSPVRSPGINSQTVEHILPI